MNEPTRILQPKTKRVSVRHPGRGATRSAASRCYAGLWRSAKTATFSRATVGRELDMIALKQRVNELSRQLGQEPPFPLAFLDAQSAPPKGGETP